MIEFCFVEKMSEDPIQKKAIHSCFSKKFDVSQLPTYFYHPGSSNVNKWKSEATIYALQLLEDEFPDTSDSHYSTTDDEDNISKDEYDQFINALPSCIPLFGHLYNINKDSTFNLACWCP